MKNDNWCSFCGKSPKEVEWVIAGPNVFICNECVDICNDTIKEKNAMTEEDKEIEVTINEDCKVEGNEVEMEMTAARHRSLDSAMERERTDAYIRNIEGRHNVMIKKHDKETAKWIEHVNQMNATTLVQTVAIIAVCTVVSLAVIFVTMGG